MLSYLETIFSLITQLFGGWWSILSWIITTAYNYLTSYVNDLQGSLTDYKWYRAATLIYHQTYVKDKADDILVNNYTTTRYSAIDSFSDLFDFRTYKKSTLDWLHTYAKSSIQTILIGGFSILYYLISNPIGFIQYVLTKGRETVQDYETNDKSNVKIIGPHARQVSKITSEPDYSILNKVTGGWYLRLKTTIEDYFPIAGPIFNASSKILSLVVGLIYTRLSDIGERQYPKLSSLHDNYDKLIQYTNEQNLRKYNYLLNEKFPTIVSLIERPDTTLLGALKGKFFEWFLTELWDWLNEEIEVK